MTMRIMMIDPLLTTLAYDRLLVSALVEAGHEVLSCGRPLKKNERWDKRYGEYFEIGFDWANPPLTHSAMRRRVYWFYYHVRYLKALLLVARKSKEFKADIVHIQWMHAPVLIWFFLRLISKNTGKLLTMHDSQVANGDKVLWLQILGLDQALRSFDHIIVHTESSAARLRNRGVEGDKLSIIPHGLLTADIKQTSAPPTSNSKLTFMLFGRLAHYKGVDVLIRAVQAMKPSVRERCRFVVAGNPTIDVNEMLHLSKRCNVFELFDFRLGFIPEDELASTLSSADIFVFPYREIDASGVLMLILQYGKPIVASDIGLFSEMLTSGLHGILTKPADAQELAEAIECLACDADFRLRSGMNVRRLTNQIPTWAEIAYKTSRVYQDIIRIHKGSQVNLMLDSD
jgi:glycosyltransferase involved in cell wall biosynthesis